MPFVSCWITWAQLREALTATVLSYSKFLIEVSYFIYFPWVFLLLWTGAEFHSVVLSSFPVASPLLDRHGKWEFISNTNPASVLRRQVGQCCAASRSVLVKTNVWAEVTSEPPGLGLFLLGKFSIMGSIYLIDIVCLFCLLSRHF
jgi:hypothetical protein